MTDALTVQRALDAARRTLGGRYEAAATSGDIATRARLGRLMDAARELMADPDALRAIAEELRPANDLEKYAPANARRIAEQLVDDALAKRLVVAVWDGEAWALKRSADRAAILARLASTEADTLHFWRADGTRVGWAMLIWQNDGDVISDNSDNPETEELLASAMALANTLAEEA